MKNFIRSLFEIKRMCGSGIKHALITGITGQDGSGERYPWDVPNYPSENRIINRALRMKQ